MRDDERMNRVYAWIEFDYRPKKDGLHDSGYRFLRCFGVYREDGELAKDDLNQWADHIEFMGPSNIDVEPDGTIRVMSRAKGWKWVGYQGSDAMFAPADWDEALHRVRFEADFARQRKARA